MLKVVTDSAVGLPRDLVEADAITIVPLVVHFGNATYREYEELGNDQFYQMLREAEQLPTTSQPSAGDFYEVYSRLTAQGDGVISIHLSSKLSGTYQSAVTAREMLPEADITVMDSQSVSAGQGLAVLAAAEAIQKGKSRDEVIALVEKVIESLRIIFIVDTLEYLQKGGRIGGAAAMLGTLLNFKPLLEVREGRVEPLERVRSRKKAVQRALEVMAERCEGHGLLRMAVLHAQCPEEAERLAQEVKAQFPCVSLHVAEIGPAIGTHTGPGALGIVSYADGLMA